MRTRGHCLLWVLLAFGTRLHSQETYADSLQSYLKHYVKAHEVVKGKDAQYFRFFPINEKYRVVADFTRTDEKKWFSVSTTSGLQKQTYCVYGTATFTWNDTLVQANVYQSQFLLSDPKHKDYLVLMFTDKTTGNDTYDAGRYIDLSVADIQGSRITIDFNKAYNPYCAYVKNVYSCPIPPRENALPVAITAGEKSFGKKIE